METETAVGRSTPLDDPEEFETALGEAAGPLAVVGPPFAGRGRLLDDAVTELGAKRVRLSPRAEPEPVMEALDEGPLVIEGCHHLYHREIGGFDGLETVLDGLIGTTEPVVTGWNSYAWSYLDAVRDIGSLFVDHFEIPKRSSEELADVVSAHVDSLPAFRNDQLTGELVERRHITVGSTGRTVPVPVPNGERVHARVFGRRDPKQATFDRLADAATGNPGVALALWDHAVSDGTITPGDIQPPSVDVDREGAFVLRLLLEREHVNRQWLTRRFDSGVTPLLERLAREGIVSIDGSSVRLEPVGVPAAVTASETWRVV